MDKNSNFIGQFFRQQIKQYRVDKERLAKELNFDYANNVRMIYAYLAKKDYLWEQFEVENWCNALHIRKNAVVYGKLMDKAGKKKCQ